MALLACLAGPARAQAPGQTPAPRIRAEDYDAFWLWGGVALQPVLARARTVYVLQGQVQARRAHEEETDIVAQGIAVPRLRRGEAWLVYRARTLRWTPRIYAIILAQVRRWRAAGNPVAGLQIDFDARTKYLPQYVAFLRELRSHLPPDLKLGITGLLDWSSRAEPDTVNELRNVVDEVVVQTYQGRHTIADYAAYLPRVSRLALPFKIGVIQDGEWQAPAYLAQSPWFRGYVVFLRNPEKSSRD
jgi:hypothetical protein